jgi:hypothetical protein
MLKPRTKYVIIDATSIHSNRVKWGTVEKLVDAFVVISSKYLSREKYKSPCKVIIFSNTPPAFYVPRTAVKASFILALSLDRWRVFQID